ncbi:MAG: NAD(P)-binding domain-containing protein [Acidimicrobiia bacterium]
MHGDRAICGRAVRVGCVVALFSDEAGAYSIRAGHRPYGRGDGRHFGRSGFELVVWNRDEVKAKALASSLGVDVAGTAGEAASRSSVVLTSLADDQAVKPSISAATESTL